ncbi:MAG: serine hydrolase domain-containing protein [Saprospiraceae bacterium]
MQTPLILRFAAGALLFAFPWLCASQALTAKMDAYVQSYAQTNNFSGVILVKQKDKTIYQKAFGFANLEHQVPHQINTVFQLASVSKPFTAAAILWLEAHGKLKVSDSLSKFVPDYPHGDQITLHHLLTHTSGIPNINNFPAYDTITRFPQTPDKLIPVFKNLPLNFTPGERYEYSNSNYNLLAFIVEQASGKSFGDFLQETFFTPLGMNDTRHRADVKQIVPRLATGYEAKGKNALQQAVYTDWSAKIGNGSLYSTVEDLYKWDRAMYSDKILPKAAREKMLTNHIDNTGYGWFLRPLFDKKRAYINGRSPGYSAYLVRFLEEDVCIIVLSNNYVPVATQIGNDLAAILFNQPYTAPRLGTTNLSKTEMQQLVGTYQFGADFFRPNDVLHFREVKDELICEWGAVLPLGNNKFILRDFWVECSFEKDAAGQPVLVVGESRAVKIK